MDQAQFVGIDLGTSTSGLAWLRADGSPEMVANADAERLTPSAIYFPPSGAAEQDTILVGSSAQTANQGDRTVINLKRHMDDPNYSYEIDGKNWTPAMLASLILSKLKNECSTIIGDIKDVVLTVPANFNELARRSTVQAAELAGLNVTRLVNEPTAAAMYYTHLYGIEGKILVYDLGGGTLDITILEAASGNFNILLSEGARHLGGSHFDELLLDMYSESLHTTLGTSLYQNESEKYQALSNVEGMKKMLSKLQKHVLTISQGSEHEHQVEITREAFEDSISRLLLRTVMLVEQALNSVELAASDIDHVVLVGGSTRIPKVQSVIEEIFNQKPLSCGNVDECVALGAALFARDAAQVQEVCNASYGTIALVENALTGEQSIQNAIVIPKNTLLPCSATQVFYTSEEDEDQIELEITQGEDTDPEFVDIIGRMTMPLPKGRAAGSEIRLTYSYDLNQRIKAELYDVATGQSEALEIEYEGQGVMDKSDIERHSSYLKKIIIQ